MSMMLEGVSEHDVVKSYASIKSPHQQAVESFMQAVPGQAPACVPRVPSAETRVLRARLILEEALETIDALGVDTSAAVEHTFTARDIPIGRPEVEEEFLIGVADGCCDLKVVTTGTLSACGLADVALQQEVDENNLLKFRKGHRIDEHGKLIKPADHPSPDLRSIIRAQGPLLNRWPVFPAAPTSAIGPTCGPHEHTATALRELLEVVNGCSSEAPTGKIGPCGCPRGPAGKTEDSWPNPFVGPVWEIIADKFWGTLREGAQ